MKPIENNQKKSTPRKRKFTLKEKVREHLQDKNHVITDEDIREVVVGPEAVNLEAEREGHPEEKIENIAEKMEKELPENKKTTPWDIISES